MQRHSVLMSLLTLSIFYGYFLENPLRKRTVLALASVPIAIAANAVRIVGHRNLRSIFGIRIRRSGSS